MPSIRIGDYFNDELVMKIKNHIGDRFIHDSNFVMAMTHRMHPEAFHKLETMLSEERTVENLMLRENPLFQRMMVTWYCLDSRDQMAYWISNSVIESLEHIKVKKKSDHFDWSVFLHLKDQKKTFLFPNNSLLRFTVQNNVLWWCYLTNKGGSPFWTMFFVNRDSGNLSENFDTDDVIKIEEFIYKFMCFFYLSEHEYKLLKPNEKFGTRKGGKVINDSKGEVTIVNSSWNITAIRTEGFGVRGHFATRWVGSGRNTPKLVYIEPFRKNGYIRKAKKDQIL